MGTSSRRRSASLTRGKSDRVDMRPFRFTNHAGYSSGPQSARRSFIVAAGDAAFAPTALPLEGVARHARCNGVQRGGSGMSTTAARTVSSRLTASHGEERPVGIPHGSEFLTGSLASVPAPRAVVLIANGRGYGRHVPALRALADELRIAGFATLIADVVPAGENCMGRELDAAAARLASARAWLASSKH